VGIAVTGLKNSQITNNIVFDAGERQFGSEGIDEIVLKKVASGPGQHADLLVCSAGGVPPTVVCRNNYHPDGTPLVPRDNQFKIIESGLLDLPLEAGRGVTFTPVGGKVRIDAAGGEAAPAAPEFAGLRLAHAVDAAGPGKDKHFAGAPGDYALSGEFLYIYAGDGKTHLWKRIPLADY
jgi:hypothetical protein